MSHRIASLLEEDFTFDAVPRVVPFLEEHIVLPPEMSPVSPGPFRVKSHPHTAPILECFHPNSGVRSVVFTGGSQEAAKTTTMCLGIAFRIKFSPMPTLISSRSKDWLGEQISDLRLRPLIDANPQLRMEKPYNPDEFKRHFMKMAGGPISLQGANSPTGLAGGTQGIVCIDEAAKIQMQQTGEDGVGNEMHPIDQAEDRMKAFLGQEFFWLSSTPNTPQHRFWEHFEKRDQTHFYAPCPNCREYFRYEFELSGVKKLEPRPAEFEIARPKDYRSVVWSPLAQNKDGSWDKPKIFETARYVCFHCGYEVTEAERRPSLQKLEQKRHNPNAPKEHRSFRAPSFYAPRTTFGQMAWKYLDRGDLFMAGMQAFFNGYLALPWELEDINVADEHIDALVAKGPDSYLVGEVPQEPAYIGITADAGQAIQYWAAGAIMPNLDIHIIDYGTVLSIEDLDGLQERHTWKMRGDTGNRPMVATSGLVDSSYLPDRVFNMCAGSGGFWFPAKGSEASYGSWTTALIPSHPSLFRFVYVDKTLKDELYDNRIFRGHAPRIVLPSNVSSDFKKSLSGQSRVITEHGTHWKRIPWDHWGDCVKKLVFQSMILKASGQI